MGKVEGTVRTVLLPSIVAIVGAILAGVLFLSGYNQNSLQNELRQRAETAHVKLAVTELQRLAMHQAIASWYAVLGRPTDRPTNEAADMRLQVKRLDDELAKLGPTGIDTKPIHIALEALERASSALTRYDAMVGVITGLKSFSLEFSRGNDADRVHFAEIQLADLQKVVQAIPMFFDLGTLVPTVRAGTGVDPAPTDPVVRSMVADLTTSSVNESGISRSPRQFVDLGDGKIATEIYVNVLLGGGAVLTREAVWVDSNRAPTFQHASFSALSRSTQAVIDDTATTVRRYVTALESGYLAEVREFGEQKRRRLAGGFLCMSLSAAGVLWLTRRVNSRMRTLRRVSERDSLTSLLNRDGLRSTITPWFASDHSAFGVAVVDLDHFKQINDQYGHSAGDHLLLTVGRRLRSEIVASSTAVARWGGDEFVVVFRLGPAATHDDLSAALRRLAKAMAEPFDLGDAIVATSASIGAVVCDAGSCNFDDLFRAADHQLYEVKRSGRNNFSLRPCAHESAGGTKAGHAVADEVVNASQS